MARAAVTLITLSALSVLGAGGCRKQYVEGPMRFHELEVAIARGQKEDKPVAIFFGATWDSAWKEIEHETLPDQEVRAIFNREAFAVYVDMSDDENRRSQEIAQRYKMVGEPAIVILGRDGATEVRRFNEFIKAPVLVKAMRDAMKPEAIAIARAAEEARRARERTEEEAWRKNPPPVTGPTVIIDMSPDAATPITIVPR